MAQSNKYILTKSNNTLTDEGIQSLLEPYLYFDNLIKFNNENLQTIKKLLGRLTYERTYKFMYNDTDINEYTPDIVYLKERDLLMQYCYDDIHLNNFK